MLQRNPKELFDQSNISAMFSGLEKMALCRRCPFEPSVAMLPSPQSQMLQGCLLWGLHLPSCCGWTLIAEWVGQVCPQASWMCGPATTASDTLAHRFGSSEGDPLWRGTVIGWCHLLCRTGWEPLFRGQPVGTGWAGKFLRGILGWDT